MFLQTCDCEVWSLGTSNQSRAICTQGQWNQSCSLSFTQAELEEGNHGCADAGELSWVCFQPSHKVWKVWSRVKEFISGYKLDKAWSCSGPRWEKRSITFSLLWQIYEQMYLWVSMSTAHVAMMCRISYKQVARKFSNQSTTKFAHERHNSLTTIFFRAVTFHTFKKQTRKKKSSRLSNCTEITGLCRCSQTASHCSQTRLMWPSAGNGSMASGRLGYKPLRNQYVGLQGRFF